MVVVAAVDDGTTTPADPVVYTGDTYTATGHAEYGGTISVNNDTGEFTVTATETNYVIDRIVVDGVPLADVQGSNSAAYTFPAGTAGTEHSVVAYFVHTINFPDPDNGTLSVSRVDGNAVVQSGEIVYDGEILTIIATPDSGYELDGALSLVGLVPQGNNRYLVDAPQGAATPSVSVSFKSSITAPVLSDGSINRTSDTTATVSFTLTGPSHLYNVYYIEQPINDDAPTKEAVVSVENYLAARSGGNTKNLPITLGEGSRAVYIVATIPAPTPAEETNISEVLRLNVLGLAPVLSGGSIVRTSETEATIGFISDKAGTAYCLVLNDEADTPTSAAVKSQGYSLGSVSVGATSNIEVALTASSKDIYVVVEAEQISEPLRIPVNVLGAPVLSDGSIVRTNDTSAVIGFTSDADGEAFCLVQNSGTAAPTREAVAAAGTSLGAVTADEPNSALAVVLTPGAKDVYVVVAAGDGKISDPLRFSVGTMQYSITIDPSLTNGTITPSKTTQVVAGETVTVVVTPAQGFALTADSLTYQPSVGAAVNLTPKEAASYEYPNNPEPTPLTFTFTMPAEPVTLTAAFYDAAAAWSGGGAVNSPYLITSVSDMEALAAAVDGGAAFPGKYFRLTADLEMDRDWIGVGNFMYLRPFSGNFDGYGHTVTLSTRSTTRGQGGAFGFVRGGSIKNLTSAGTIRAENTGFVGGIVGYLFDGAMENCVNRADITMGGRAGGIVGGFRGTVTVTGCDNYGNLTGGGSGKPGSVGGILGCDDPSGSPPALLLTVSRCRNYGSVTEQWNIAAGIVAGFNNHARLRAGWKANITDCFNYGNITVVAGARAGGILACAKADAINIVNCGNSGKISAYSRVGGIVGYAENGSIEYTTRLFIDSCMNSGYLYGEYYVGGIVGEHMIPLTLTDVYNTGTIEEKPFTQTTTYIGGLYCEGTARTTNAYNAGKILPISNDYVALLGPSINNSILAQNNYYIPQARDADGDVPITASGGPSGDGSGVHAVTAEELRGLASTLGAKWTDDIGINDGYPILLWQADTTVYPLTTTLTAPSESEARFTINSRAKNSGDTVNIAANGAANYTVTMLKQYEVTGWTANGTDVAYTSATEGLYTTYTGAVQVTGNTDVRITVAARPDEPGGDPSQAPVWDGTTVDLTWFNPDTYAGTSSYDIGTPAQLMGLAALVNGLVNTDCTVYLWDNTTMTAAQWNSGSYVLSDSGGGESQSTASYHYGAFNFDGKTVRLTSSVDMGGVYSYGSWYGPNFMPIGGQYLMTDEDTSTKLSSSFCGVFDGGGHYVYNIYADRHCAGKYGDGSSVGLIGRLGVHDNDPVDIRPLNPAVKNVAITGYIYANRSVGGIVGKIGKTTASYPGDGSVGGIIENCANYATVKNTDAKGCGGIVGAGWNGGIVRNCYNAGTIISTYPCPTAGISGSNEIKLQNCYNIGSISAASDSYAMAIGTNNSGAPSATAVLNCWYLQGSAPGGGYYNGTNNVDNSGMRTIDAMKSDNFLNALGPAFAKDTLNNNNGYPVLAWQATPVAATPATPTITVQPAGAAYTVDDTAAPLSVTAGTTDGGTLSYQWYSSADNTSTTPSDDTAVGTGSNTYTPPTTEAGTTYYYCVVTNTLDGQTATATSDVAAVAVEAEGPGVLTPPVLTPDTTGNTVGQAVDITFPTDAAWEAAVSGITVNTASLDGEQYTVNPGGINLAANVFGTPGDYSIAVAATGYSDATVIQVIYGEEGPGELTPPALFADITANTVGQAVYLTFTDDADWRSAISGVTVNENALTAGQYTVSPGAINIDAGVFTTPGNYSIAVAAAGYSAAAVTQTMQAPAVGFTIDGTANYTFTLDEIKAMLTAEADFAVGEYGTITFMKMDLRDLFTQLGITDGTLGAWINTTDSGTLDPPSIVNDILNPGHIYMLAYPKDGQSIGDAASLCIIRNCDQPAFVDNVCGITLTEVASGNTPPALTADNTDNKQGQDITLSFPDDAAWRNLISGITVNGNALTAGQYTVSPGAINIDAGVFTAPGDYSIAVAAGGYSVATVTQTIEAAVTDRPKYTVTPAADEAVCEAGETGGISTMTVKEGVTGLKYFGARITPVVEHGGKEAVVFTHLRDGFQLSLNVTKADFDLVDKAQSGFNVQAGDVVKVFIVDDLTNDIDFNPTLLQ